ncbi:MAG: hypothetical protein JO287_27250 [Pseudonocardiales bacterium]|nr:hypothetical protein [Pseudonocardiales bacterium]
MSDQARRELGEELLAAKNLAPTRPHPHTPASPGVLKTAGVAAATVTRSATRWATVPPSGAESQRNLNVPRHGDISGQGSPDNPDMSPYRGWVICDEEAAGGRAELD